MMLDEKSNLGKASVFKVIRLSREAMKPANSSARLLDHIRSTQRKGSARRCSADRWYLGLGVWSVGLGSCKLVVGAIHKRKYSLLSLRWPESDGRICLSMRFYRWKSLGSVRHVTDLLLLDP